MGSIVVSNLGSSIIGISVGSRIGSNIGVV